jgi:putative tryptophan/tyrosine transport system substrate-binding protein
MWYSAVGSIVTLLLSLLAAPLAADAQQPAKVHRVGWLSDGIRAGATSHLHEAFLHGLRDLGYVEGKNLVIERRDAEGKLERLPELAAQLVELKVDVIVTWSVPGTKAAQRATSTVPIVMAEAGDPVRTGLVPSLARPGGNTTGLSVMDPDLVGKQLQLLKEAAPTIARVAVLYNPTFPATVLGMQEAQDAGPALGLAILPMEVRTADELEAQFAVMTSVHADAVLTSGDPFMSTHHRRILDFAAKHQLPALYFWREFVEAGGLMSYGPSLPDLFRRAATYVDKILKGAKPADLPVEQPMKFELVLNLKTAHALGLTIPPNLLFQANEVIR